MKKSFETRLEAINWIAHQSKNEGQFEALREELTFNHIYTKEWFVSTQTLEKEVVMLSKEEKKSIFNS